MSKSVSSSQCSSAIVVTALMCEAKPLIELWRLKKVHDSPFAVFANKVEFGDQTIAVSVMVCGIGALNMATAVGWLGARSIARRTVWLNLGIAGHSHLPVGQALIVSKSFDEMGARAHVIPQVAKRTAGLSDIISVNVPSGDYPDNGALDMEAFAFFHAATKFSESELVQAFKVVSDNPEQPLDDLNADKIYHLIKQQRESVAEYCKALLLLAQQLPQSVFDIQVPPLRATHSQQRQCADLIDRLGYLLSNDQRSALSASLAEVTDMVSVLAILNSTMKHYQPQLDKDDES